MARRTGPSPHDDDGREMVTDRDLNMHANRLHRPSVKSARLAMGADPDDQYFEVSRRPGYCL
jgi:hypothetical protein